jgi:Tol biopolymer transport system component
MKVRTQLTKNENRKWTSMKLLSILAVVFALMLILASSGYAKQSAGVLLQSGLYKEEVNGDLEAAIEIFERVLQEFPKNRPIAAKALLHIGLCKEKLGLNEAINAYQKVVEQYPEQQAEFTIAKERIAELSKALKGIAQRPTFRKINIASKPQNGVLSPDGNKLAFMSDDAVWVVPLHGKVDPDIAGEPVRLAEVPGIWAASNMMAWSADGKSIAVYGGGNQSDLGEGSVVSVLPVSGGTPSVVRLPEQSGHLWSYRLSLSPDGQILAFSALDLGKPRQEMPDSLERYIYTIPTAGGEPKQVSSGWARMPSFSPDGKFIAYVGYRKREPPPKKTGLSRFHGDLWIVPSAGGTPVRLATADGRLRGPVWSPDGKYIAAHHEPGGTNDSKEIWVFPLSPDASSAGEPEKIALPHSSWNMLAGWTPDGELGVFIQSEQHWAIYTVPARGGKAVQVAPEGMGYYPRWSSDGERIYFRGVYEEEENVKIETLYVPAVRGRREREDRDSVCSCRRRRSSPSACAVRAPSCSQSSRWWTQCLAGWQEDRLQRFPDAVRSQGRRRRMDDSAGWRAPDPADERRIV